MPGKFVLFAQGRTGSTLLGDLLGSHPDVLFANEILSSPVRSTRLRTDWLRWRHARHVVGFHVKIYQLTDSQGIADPGAWLRRLHSRGWQVITLRRDNLLRHVLSNITAEAANRYDDRSGAPAPVRLHVDPEHLLYWMGKREQVGLDEQRALVGVPHLGLTYETDLQDPADWAATTARVFAALGLASTPVSSTLSRLNSGGLADILENLDEIKSALTGTRYERFLTDSVS
jgi:hypothetical protein